MWTSDGQKRNRENSQSSLSGRTKEPSLRLFRQNNEIRQARIITVVTKQQILQRILELAQATSGFNGIILYNPNAWDSCDDRDAAAIGGSMHVNWRLNPRLWREQLDEGNVNSYTLSA